MTQHRPAPYEPVTARRMWGVFPVNGPMVPVAMFQSQYQAQEHAKLWATAHVALAVDEVSGWAWNDIDPPELTP